MVNRKKNVQTTAVALESLSSTSDPLPIQTTSHAHALCSQKPEESVLEVTTTEVRAILVVVGIKRQTYINPVFYNFFDKDVKYLFICIAC